jgi:hypothetical protein
VILDDIHALQRSGRWESALAATDSPRRRAEILTDRHAWRFDPADEALAAIDAIRSTDPALAALLFSQVVYWHRLLKFDPSDRYGTYDPVEGFAEAAADPALAGWAAFWQGIALENLRDEPVAAAGFYEQARRASLADGDRLLESYAVRHQGAILLDGDWSTGLRLLRRSMHLRAACGARPHVTAAQRTLAQVLVEGPPGSDQRSAEARAADLEEARQLNEVADGTATELNLTWLLPKRSAG